MSTTDVKQIGNGRTFPLVVSEGAELGRWQNRLGAGLTQELVQALVQAGYGYQIQAGSASTPIASAGAYVATTPDLDILVPADKAFIPLLVACQYETIGTVAVVEMLVAAGIGGAQGTGTATTPTNMDTSLGNNSGLTCLGHTSTATLMTVGLTEIWRDGQTVGITKTTGNATGTIADPTRFVYRAKDEGFYHIVRGNASGNARLNVWTCAQAPNTFIIVKGLVVPVAFLG